MFSYSGRVKSPEGRTPFQTRTWSICWYIQVHDFRMEAAGTDLQAWTCIIYAGLPAALYARETLHFFHALRSFWWGHMWCVRLEWRTEGKIDCERSLFIPCSWLRINVKKSSVASVSSSVAFHGLPDTDHCGQRIEYRTRNSEAGCSIPSFASDCNNT